MFNAHKGTTVTTFSESNSGDMKKYSFPGRRRMFLSRSYYKKPVCLSYSVRRVEMINMWTPDIPALSISLSKYSFALVLYGGISLSSHKFNPLKYIRSSSVCDEN